jgi:hypothetical protein
MALQALATSIRKRHTVGSQEPPAAVLMGLVSELCTVVCAAQGRGDGEPRHIQEIHLANDVNRELAELRWSMKANERLPCWDELGPPAAAAVADAADRLAAHVDRIVTVRREAAEARRAQAALRKTMADAALQRLQALRTNAVPILPPPRFADATTLPAEGYWDATSYRCAFFTHSVYVSPLLVKV